MSKLDELINNKKYNYEPKEFNCGGGVGMEFNSKEKQLRDEWEVTKNEILRLEKKLIELENAINSIER